MPVKFLSDSIQCEISGGGINSKEGTHQEIKFITQYLIHDLTVVIFDHALEILLGITTLSIDRRACEFIGRSTRGPMFKLIFYVVCCYFMKLHH
jgi:hypothetical protein